MRRIPPLAAVRVFEAAARHQNFTAAAAELGMTQAAVSYQIKLIEERIGVPLFSREKRRVTLTEAGRRIAPLVTGAFDALDDAFGIARAHSESVLTISCTHSFASNWLSGRIGAFQMQHPDLAVRLTASDTLVDFAGDDVDVAVRGGAGNWTGVTPVHLMRAPIAPFASPDFLTRHRAIESSEDVMRLPRISPDDWWWPLWFECSGGAGAQPAPASGVRFDSQTMDGRAAIAGHGVAILNALLWRSEIAAGRLVQVGPDVDFDRGHFFLVYPEHRRNVPKVKAFREWIAQEARSEDDSASRHP